MIIGYKNNAPQKITIKRPCQGYYLRWWYLGWHYFFFKPGQQSLITEGEKYRTIGTKSVMMGSGQITYDQCQSIRTIMNTREVYILTSDGWKNMSIAPGSLVVFDNQVNGYEVELTAKIGSKEISVTGFSPIISIPIGRIPVTSPDTITITTVIDGVFVLVITGDAGATVVIDWGDGTTETITLTGSEQTITHDYTGSGGVETTITITGDLPNITDLGLSGNDITVIILAEDLTELVTLDVSNNDLTYLDIPDTLTHLTDLDISDNNFTELPVIPITVPVTDLNTTGNPLTICEVQIGTQVWMCKNYDSDFPGSLAPNGIFANIAGYGRLYTSDMVNAPGFCPPGWHVPTLLEWETLVNFVGGPSIAGKKLKSAGLSYFLPPNTGDDAYGFDGRGSGYGYLLNGIFGYQMHMSIGYFLTKDVDAYNFALSVSVRSDVDEATYEAFPKRIYQPVRLVRNWLQDIGPVTYNDYFLPSKDELNAMHAELCLHGVGGFDVSSGQYWSSSQHSGLPEWDAWYQSFITGAGGFQGPASKAGLFYVRACRSFISATNYNLRDVGPAGGLIFWKSVNDYLEAAPSDQSSFPGTQKWSNINGLNSGANGTAIGTGLANTNAIIGQVGHTTSAALLCKNLVIIH